MDTMEFLAAKMAERAQQGLQLVVQDSQGAVFTLYPKDTATFAQWMNGYIRQGYTILSSRS